MFHEVRLECRSHYDRVYLPQMWSMNTDAMKRRLITSTGTGPLQRNWTLIAPNYLSLQAEKCPVHENSIYLEIESRSVELSESRGVKAASYTLIPGESSV